MELDEEIDFFNTAEHKENLDLAKVLLEEGTNLNTWNKNHWTPLYSAVAKQKSELVKLFLERGAEVNFPNRHNLGTPLHGACEVGRCDYVKLLLENGAEVNKVSGMTESTALFVASERGHCDIVEVLIANNADVNLPNKKNEIPLDVACQNGHFQVVKVLLNNGANVNWIGSWEGTPLIYACEKDNFDIVKLLLNRGANVNPIGHSRFLHTPLYHAALHGYTRVVKLLLQKGAFINWPEGTGDTPLHAACYKGHNVLAEVLLEIGAEMNRLSVDGKSPLYIACAAGHSIIVDMLLNRGADVEQDIESAWDLSWHTPLFLALREGHREMIGQLLNKDIVYSKDKPKERNENDVRSFLYFSKLMHLNSGHSNVCGKFYCQHILKEHFTRLKIAGLVDKSGSEEEILSRPTCIAEVERINSLKVFQDVTLGIVFQRAKNPFYLKNENLRKKIEDYLNSTLPELEFPIYVYILRNTLNKSKWKFTLLTSATNVLVKHECHHKLPVLVLENILKYLDEKDLEKISNLTRD